MQAAASQSLATKFVYKQIDKLKNFDINKTINKVKYKQIYSCKISQTFRTIKRLTWRNNLSICSSDK